MTFALPLAVIADPCASCRGSVEGCWARRAAGFGRCCRGCSHTDPQPEVVS